jgi:hypothetical protein
MKSQIYSCNGKALETKNWIKKTWIKDIPALFWYNKRVNRVGIPSELWGRVASTGEVSYGIASRAVINSQN